MFCISCRESACAIVENNVRRDVVVGENIQLIQMTSCTQRRSQVKLKVRKMEKEWQKNQIKVNRGRESS